MPRTIDEVNAFLQSGNATRGEEVMVRIAALAGLTDAQQQYMYQSATFTPPDARNLLAFLDAAFGVAVTAVPIVPSSKPRFVRIEKIGKRWYALTEPGGRRAFDTLIEAKSYAVEHCGASGDWRRESEGWQRQTDGVVTRYYDAKAAHTDAPGATESGNEATD